MANLLSGGGVALLYAAKELDKLPTANFDQKVGVQIIQNALKVCFCYFSAEIWGLHIISICLSHDSWAEVLH